MRGRRWGVGVCAAAILALAGYVATPYARAAALLVRVADAGGTLAGAVRITASPVLRDAPQTLSTRHGPVPWRLYRPGAKWARTVLLVPGIHSMGIDEPRLTALAEDLAATGYGVVTLALPDLTTYRITTNATDVIEDSVAALSAQPRLAEDGRIGLAGISFAGGLSIVAAGRHSIRDKLAFVLSFGGHGDLPRVLRYLATGQETAVAGVKVNPPHDYGLAVLLFGLAGAGVVPAEQAASLRAGVETFLLASQLTLVSMDQANAAFAKARDLAAAMPEPSRTYMGYVNDRDVAKLGPVLLPFLDRLGAGDPALSPQRADAPTAPVFLLHGDEDTVIPPAESVLLADTYRAKRAHVRVLLSPLITHAELDRVGDLGEAWRLVAFWADVLGR